MFKSIMNKLNVIRQEKKVSTEKVEPVDYNLLPQNRPLGTVKEVKKFQKSLKKDEVKKQFVSHNLKYNFFFTIHFI